MLVFAMSLCFKFFSFHLLKGFGLVDSFFCEKVPCVGSEGGLTFLPFLMHFFSAH